jgi:xanthine dehydrogenase YagT iron-sulfur-binding subunit
MQFLINKKPADFEFDTRTSLLDLLRDHLHLLGSKKGCNQGPCGAYTVLADDGERILSCRTLAVHYQGRKITTIEGLSQDGELHPLQKALSGARWLSVWLLHTQADMLRYRHGR